MPVSDKDYDGRIDYTVKFYVVVGSLSLFFNYLFYVCLETASARQVKRIRNRLFESLIRQEMGFFDKNTPGELNSILTGNLSMIQYAFGQKLGGNTVQFLSIYLL